MILRAGGKKYRMTGGFGWGTLLLYLGLCGAAAGNQTKTTCSVPLTLAQIQEPGMMANAILGKKDN